MDDRTMSWDPSLLRKYSSTGHFRLLNQLKGDLSKRPLDRDASSGALQCRGPAPDPDALPGKFRADLRNRRLSPWSNP